MGKTRKSQNTSLGKSLMKKNKPGWDKTWSVNDRHSQAPVDSLKSITQESSYDEFIATATLADKEFTAEKLNVKFVTLSAADPINDDSSNYLNESERMLVTVPRRPPWTKEMTAEELDEAEKEAFLTWRRHMAKLQEKDGITPFERNVEVWRQLWRVLERSNIVVQIVDARNPLLYRCDDLESYVKELGKQNVLLINKADYLTEKQRIDWSNYLDSMNLPHAFYSAATVNASLSTVRESDSEEDGEESTFSSSEDDDTLEKNEIQRNLEQDKVDRLNETRNSNKTNSDKTRILSRDELVQFLKSFNNTGIKPFNVGLVGYPNVGKSSTINSLMAEKKTSVSSTPGKTKHFQTLFLETDLMLCDCPGLVMPSFGGAQGEMVLGGILPIDTLTTYAQAVAFLCQRIPKSVLEYRYGITLPEQFNHDDLLGAYASIRGFMTVRGLPDSARASRIILKDYVNGRLNYCHAPPQVNQDNYQPQDREHFKQFLGLSENEDLSLKKSAEKSSINNKDTHVQKPTTLKQVSVEKKLDGQFFAPNTGQAHIKGRHYIASGLTSTSSSSTGLSDKSWKKHHNAKKREKLRRVYRHLDVE